MSLKPSYHHFNSNFLSVRYRHYPANRRTKVSVGGDFVLWETDYNDDIVNERCFMHLYFDLQRIHITAAITLLYKHDLKKLWRRISYSMNPVSKVLRCRDGLFGSIGISKQILLLGRLASVRTVNSQWGRRIQLLYWPYYKLINTAPVHLSQKHTSRRQNHKQTSGEMLH